MISRDNLRGHVRRKKNVFIEDLWSCYTALIQTTSPDLHFSAQLTGNHSSQDKLKIVVHLVELVGSTKPTSLVSGSGPKPSSICHVSLLWNGFIDVAEKEPFWLS